MIASDREYPISAQKIEVLGARAIVQVLSGAAAKAHVVTDGPQNPHHLLIEMARMHLIAVGVVLGVELSRIQARGGIARHAIQGSMLIQASSSHTDATVVQILPETFGKATPYYMLHIRTGDIFGTHHAPVGGHLCCDIFAFGPGPRRRADRRMAGCQWRSQYPDRRLRRRLVGGRLLGKGTGHRFAQPQSGRTRSPHAWPSDSPGHAADQGGPVGRRSL